MTMVVVKMMTMRSTILMTCSCRIDSVVSRTSRTRVTMKVMTLIAMSCSRAPIPVGLTMMEVHQEQWFDRLLLLFRHHIVAHRWPPLRCLLLLLDDEWQCCSELQAPHRLRLGCLSCSVLRSQ